MHYFCRTLLQGFFLHNSISFLRLCTAIKPLSSSAIYAKVDINIKIDFQYLFAFCALLFVTNCSTSFYNFATEALKRQTTHREARQRKEEKEREKEREREVSNVSSESEGNRIYLALENTS